MAVALRDMGFDKSMLSALHDVLDLVDDVEKLHHPSRAYIRDKKAMKSTPADVIEYPKSYHFVVDMTGLKSEQIKVRLEDGNTLVVSGERRREKEKEGVKFVKIERSFGKLLKKFVLPENVNTESISAFCEAGVLTIIVEKKPPPEPKKPKVIEVKGGAEGGGGGGGGGRQDWHETEESWGRSEKCMRFLYHDFDFNINSTILFFSMFDVHLCSS